MTRYKTLALNSTERKVDGRLLGMIYKIPKMSKMRIQEKNKEIEKMRWRKNLSIKRIT